jgi:two-component system, chemotaxis family, chemotaxis protein CheY
MRVDFTRLRFLVIDDNTFMRRVIRALLHGFGAREVFEADDGAAGLESFLSHQPDVVILDWEMPILDGLEVARMIRTPSNSINPYTPIIMVSGHSEKTRVNQARDAGVNEFLVKPISSKALYDRVFAVVASPRNFVKTKTFFGPDRRRNFGTAYTGKEKRSSEATDVIVARTASEKAKTR